MNALSTITEKDRRRVVAAAALMSSDQDGEALAAVRATCRLLQPLGVGPADLIDKALSERSRLDTPPPFRPAPAAILRPHQRMAQMCLCQRDLINAWEREFLTSIKAQADLTTRQQEKLAAIVEKIDMKLKECPR